jgi:hypothetical protein
MTMPIVRAAVVQAEPRWLDLRGRGRRIRPVDRRRGDLLTGYAAMKEQRTSPIAVGVTPLGKQHQVHRCRSGQARG